MGLFLASLGPVSDGDSLNYHLGVPLDWIRHGGAQARADWLHARLIGWGDMINLLGLGAGTDCLSSVFQFAGLIMAVFAVNALAKTAAGKIMGILLVVSSPLMVVLTISQKPQLLPCAAMTTALVLVISRFRALDAGSAFLCLSCLAFAIACKYSFLLTGILILPIIFCAAWRAGRLGRVALFAAALLIFAVAPIYLRNLAFYGDPLSPLLERWRSGADPIVKTFAWYLHNFAGERTWDNLLKLPWNLVATRDPGKITTVLGIGTFAFFMAAFKRTLEARIMLVAAAAAALLILIFSQLTARFFLEPYLWVAAAAVASPWRKAKNYFLGALVVQALVMAGIATYSAV
jgi:hypothetical protein